MLRSRFSNFTPDQLDVLRVLPPASDDRSTGIKYRAVMEAVNIARAVEEVGSPLQAPRVISVLQTLQGRRLAIRRGTGQWSRTEAGTRVLKNLT